MWPFSTASKLNSHKKAHVLQNKRTIIAGGHEREIAFSAHPYPRSESSPDRGDKSAENYLFHTAYAAYTHGYIEKFNYFLRTIPNTENHLQSIKEVLRNEFIPAVTGGHDCSTTERELLALPVRLGGLGTDIPGKISNSEYKASRKVTKHLINGVKQQIENEPTIQNEKHDLKSIKNEIRKERKESYESRMTEITSAYNENEKRQLEIIQQPGCSSCLTTSPLEEFNYTLSKQRVLGCNSFTLRLASSKSTSTMCR